MTLLSYVTELESIAEHEQCMSAQKVFEIAVMIHLLKFLKGLVFANNFKQFLFFCNLNRLGTIEK